MFSWKGLEQDVEEFVKQCSVFQQAKHEHCKLPGLLCPLIIPNGAWQDWTMDFIEGLPRSEGSNAILVVVDRFTKYVHLFPLKHPFTTVHIAKVVLDNVVKLHGIPRTITSNRDKIFTSLF